MKLVISKKFPKAVRRIIRAAVAASNAHAPMSVRTLIVKPTKGHDYHGLAKKNEDVAVIEICHTQEDYLDTVFHECYHIYQYSQGIVVSEDNGFKWRGVYIPLFLYNMFHSFVPFEISAKAYAKKMCKKVEALK